MFFAGWKGVPAGQDRVRQAVGASMIGWYAAFTAHVLASGISAYAVFNIVMAAAALPPVIGLALSRQRLPKHAIRA